jgi:hypothetical protein
LGFRALRFEGRETIFPDELGALFAAWLLRHPPPEPIHAVSLALEGGCVAGGAS